MSPLRVKVAITLRPMLIPALCALLRSCCSTLASVSFATPTIAGLGLVVAPRGADEISELSPAVELPREQDVRIRTATRFTRTHILRQSTSCFRQLLTMDPGVRYARPEVITGPFGGRSAEMVATELKRNLEFELRLRRIESGDAQNAGRGCDGSGVAEAEERKICRDLAYLDELDSLLIKENTNAENLQ